MLATTVADFARRAWQPALCVRVRAHPPTTHKAWWEYEEQLARLAFDLRGRLAFDLRGEATAMRLPPCERPTRRMSAFF